MIPSMSISRTRPHPRVLLATARYPRLGQIYTPCHTLPRRLLSPSTPKSTSTSCSTSTSTSSSNANASIPPNADTNAARRRIWRVLLASLGVSLGTVLALHVLSTSSPALTSLTTHGAADADAPNPSSNPPPSKETDESKAPTQDPSSSSSPPPPTLPAPSPPPPTLPTAPSSAPTLASFLSAQLQAAEAPPRFDMLVKVEGEDLIHCAPSMGVRRRDMFRVGSNAPPEDAISASDLALSPTLTLSTTAIFDGHNGPRLAEFLAVGLPVVVRSLVQDVFVRYARLEEAERGGGVGGGLGEGEGVDLGGGGRVVRLGGEGVKLKGAEGDKDKGSRSGAAEGEEVGTHADIARRLRLGDLPDPSPPDEEVDAAIRQAFRGLDEVIVHESARLVLGLSRKEYDAIRGGGEWDWRAWRAKQDAKAKAKAKEEEGKEGRGKGKNNGKNRGKIQNGTGSRRYVQGRMLTRAEALEELYGAYAGSCAIMTLFNPKDRTLRVALTGDSRAVYGRRVPAPPSPNATPTSTSTSTATSTSTSSSTTSSSPQTPAYTHIYTAERLTQDQTPSNPTEVALISSQHPTEPPSALFKNGRFLGWGPTRAFGDGSMKWPVPIQRALYNLGFFGDRVRVGEGVGEEGQGGEGRVGSTPPYMTAEPVVTKKDKVERGDFVVLGSDGLWECLTDEEVVGLVGVWLEERGVKERVAVKNDFDNDKGTQGRIKDKDKTKDKIKTKDAREKEKEKEREVLLPPLPPRTQKSLRQYFAEALGDRRVSLDPSNPTTSVEVTLRIPIESSSPSSTSPTSSTTSPTSPNSTSSSAATTSSPTPATFLPSQLPVHFPENYRDTTPRYPQWRAPKKFILDPGDANVAAHVVRNALGGADADLREALCALEGGRGRRFRDDISVVVVFFD